MELSATFSVCHHLENKKKIGAACIPCTTDHTKKLLLLRRNIRIIIWTVISRNKIAYKKYWCHSKPQLSKYLGYKWYTTPIKDLVCISDHPKIMVYRYSLHLQFIFARLLMFRTSGLSIELCCISTSLLSLILSRAQPYQFHKKKNHQIQSTRR